MDIIMSKERLLQAKDNCSRILEDLNNLREEINRQEEALKAYNAGVETGVKFSATLKGMVDGGMPEDLAKELLFKGILGGI